MYQLLGVCTHRSTFSADWEDTATRSGFNPIVLGLGEKWTGFDMYQSLLIEYLQSCEYNKMIVITDVFDVLVVGSPRELDIKYRSMKAPIVVGAEKTCAFNCLKNHGSHGINHSVFKYINTGMVVGKAGDLLKMYQWCVKRPRHETLDSEQVAVSLYKKAFPGIVALDGEQSMVANTSKKRDLKPIDGRRFVHTVTHQKPVFVHIPFMYKDLGERHMAYRAHVVNTPNHLTKIDYFVGFMKHVYRHRNMKAYRPLFIGIVFSIVFLLLVVIIVPTTCVLIKRQSRIDR